MTQFPNSLRIRLLAYFDANPDEELSRGDIAVKFSVSTKTVDLVLSQLKKSGQLEPVHAWRRPDSPRARAFSEPQ
jgi:transposase